MKIKQFKKLAIYIIVTIFALLSIFFINKYQKQRLNALPEQTLINHLLKSTNKSTLKSLNISHGDVLTDNLENYNTSIITNKNNNYYKILQVYNKKTEKDFICVYKYSLFSYKQIGNPLEFNNITNASVLETKDNESILFVRDLIGFKTSPLDLTSKLYAFTYNDNSRNFTKALELIENSEEYLIMKNEVGNYYKKYRTKSDIMLTNSVAPVLKVLTHFSESVSSIVKTNLAGTPPYSLDFDVIKTNNSFDTYVYDKNYHSFLLGYLKIDSTEEIVGILKKTTKIINENFVDTYTVIKPNGEVFEIYDGFTIEKLY